MSIPIQFVLTFDDYLQAQKLHGKRSFWSRIWQTMRVTLIPVLGLIFIFSGIMMIGPGVSVFSIIYVILCGIFLTCYPIYIRHRYKRCYKRTRTEGSQCTITLQDDNILTETENSKSELDWKAIRSVRESDHVILLYMAPAKFLALPKRVISTEELTEVQQLLRVHVTDFRP